MDSFSFPAVLVAALVEAGADLYIRVFFAGAVCTSADSSQ